MADRRPSSASEAAPGQGAISALAVTTLAVVAAVAGVVLWLALSVEDTMTRLRAEADRRSLQAELELPEPPSVDDTAALAPPVPEPSTAQAAEEPAAAADEGASGSRQADTAAPAAEETAPPSPPPPDDPAPVAPDPPPAATVPPEPAEATASPADDAGISAGRGKPQLAALPAAPDPALIESTPAGALPRVGPDGREPWQAYARPFDAAKDSPRIAIVITDLGQSDAATETAIQGLPGPVTLAFAPYASGLRTWLPEARAAGHETLLMVPMEPASYPRNDPGPHTLLTSLAPEENRQRLDWVLARAKGYVGVVNAMGSRLTTAPEALRPVLEALDSRGLMFVDSRTVATSVAGRVAGEIGLPHAANDRFVADVASRDAIDLRLQELEALAREQGHAVGFVYPYPVSFERLAEWIPTLEEKGFVLAPITAIAAAEAGRSG